MRSIYCVSCSAYTLNYSSFACFCMNLFVHSEAEARGVALEACQENFPRNKFSTDYLIVVNKVDMEWLTRCCQSYNETKIPVPQEHNPLLEIKL